MVDHVELIGVPFDGYGRAGNQAAASEALRVAGLASAFGSLEVTDCGDLELPAPDPNRGAVTSLMNEAALLAMVERVGEAVTRAVENGRFPVVHGGDCSTLLGVIPALQRTRSVALLFLDGHEDTMPLDISEDGEAANTEIGLLLGLTGHLLKGPLASAWESSTGETLPFWGRAMRRGDGGSMSAPCKTTECGSAAGNRPPRGPRRALRRPCGTYAPLPSTGGSA